MPGSNLTDSIKSKEEEEQQRCKASTVEEEKEGEGGGGVERQGTNIAPSRVDGLNAPDLLVFKDAASNSWNSSDVDIVSLLVGIRCPEIDSGVLNGNLCKRKMN